MSVKTRTLSVLAGVAAAALGVSLAAAPAQAAPWLSDPGSCTSVQGAVSRVVSGRTVEVRYGRCGGTQYGWGRIVGYSSSQFDYIRFEVDVNGDRVQDGASYYLAWNRNYTAGYPTASGSTRAFRACYVNSGAEECTAGNSTAWW